MKMPAKLPPIISPLQMYIGITITITLMLGITFGFLLAPWANPLLESPSSSSDQSTEVTVEYPDRWQASKIPKGVNVRNYGADELLHPDNKDENLVKIEIRYLPTQEPKHINIQDVLNETALSGKAYTDIFVSGGAKVTINGKEQNP